MPGAQRRAGGLLRARGAGLAGGFVPLVDVTTAFAQEVRRKTRPEVPRP